MTLIKESDFGTGRERHTVELGLIEPEAAAVFTVRDSAVRFQAGNTMVSDADGGMTDLAILRTVTEDEDEDESKLGELDVAKGKDVSPTDVDFAFENLVDKRLGAVTAALPDNIASSMMHSSEFQNWKCTFGQEDNRDFSSFLIPVPEVGSDFNHREAKIVDGKMPFSQ